MFCPMGLDCKAMTGVIYNCPNLSECLENSPLNRMEAIRLYYLNQGEKQTENIGGVRRNRRSPRSNQPEPHQTTFIYNRDSQTRDRIIFSAPIKWEETYGGAKSFYNLTIEKLQQLIAQEFANPTARHQLSPTIREMMEFAQQQASKGFEFTFEGEAISPDREDYRVSIDAMVFSGSCTHQLIVEFQEFVCDSDEIDLDPDYLRAWWD